MEIWKNIHEFEGYQVSNTGRVKGKRFGKDLKHGLGGKNRNYPMVVLRDKKNNKTRTVAIHRLVFEAFTSMAIPNGWVIDHTNEDTTNNNYSNLQILTSAANCIKSKKLSTRKFYNRWKAQYGRKYIGMASTQKDAEQLILDYLKETDIHTYLQITR